MINIKYAFYLLLLLLLSCGEDNKKDDFLELSSITLNNASYTLNVSNSSFLLRTEEIDTIFVDIIHRVDSSIRTDTINETHINSCTGTLEGPIEVYHNSNNKVSGLLPDYYACTYMGYDTLFIKDTILSYYRYYDWNLTFKNNDNLTFYAHIPLTDTGAYTSINDLSINLGYKNYIYVVANDFGINDTIRSGYIDIKHYDQSRIDLQYFFTIENRAYSGYYDGNIHQL